MFIHKINHNRKFYNKYKDSKCQELKSLYKYRRVLS